MILFFYIEVDNIVEMMYDPARKCAGFFSFNYILIISWKGGNGCTGSSCMKAMNYRKGTFSRYESEEVELQAFFQCSGCGNDLENNDGLQRKADRILEIAPDAVHVGVCTIEKDTKKRCTVIRDMMKLFREHGIDVLNGTHDSDLLQEVIE